MVKMERIQYGNRTIEKAIIPDKLKSLLNKTATDEASSHNSKAGIIRLSIQSDDDSKEYCFHALFDDGEARKLSEEELIDLLDM